MNGRVKHIKVLVIPADEAEPMYTRQIPQDELFGELRKIVGGFIESLNTGERSSYTAYANEESRLIDLPPNTRFNRYLGPDAENYEAKTVISSQDANGHWVQDITMHPGMPRGFALGNVVVCGPVDQEGYDTSVKTTVVERFSAVFGQDCIQGL